MTEIDVKWTKENVWEFVKFNSFRRSRGVTLTFIAFICCYGLLLGLCLAGFFVIQNYFMLICAIVLTLFVAGYALVFYRMLKKYAAKLLEANSDEEARTVRFDEEQILVLKSGEPIGKLSWSNIGNIYFNDEKGAAYIMTKENALLLIEYANIREGSKEELKKLLEGKNAELSKKT